jgi:hypothetical protein
MYPTGTTNKDLLKGRIAAIAVPKEMLQGSLTSLWLMVSFACRSSPKSILNEYKGPCLRALAVFQPKRLQDAPSVCVSDGQKDCQQAGTESELVCRSMPLKSIINEQ